MIPQKKPTAADLVSLLHAMGKRIEKLARLLAAAEELLDGIACDFAEAAEIYGVSPAAILGTCGPNHHPPVLIPEQRRILQALASQGVIAVKIQAQADGSATAEVDGRDPVPLPRMLAHLLAVLITDNDASQDHLVGWKTSTEISSAMAKRAGKPFKKHAISQLISRLKQLLSNFSESPFLIQHNPQLGYRFALRRSAGPVTERDHR